MKAYRQNAGLTRAAGILLVLVLVMLVITIVPFVIRWREESATFNCALSVEKMQDLLDMEVLFRQRTLTPKETAEFLKSYHERGEILCPDGGEFDAVERDSMSMEVVCCRHDSNTARRTRLCAERVLDRVRTEIRKQQISGIAFPDSVKVTLNSRTVTAVRVEAPTLLRRGTATTRGYKGIVAFYALAGEPEDVDLANMRKSWEEQQGFNSTGAGAQAASSETGTGAQAASSETGTGAQNASSDTDTVTQNASSETATVAQNASSDTDTGAQNASSDTDTVTQNAYSDTSIGAQNASSDTDTVAQNASSDTGEGSGAAAGSSETAAGSSETDDAVPFLPDGDAEAGEVWYFSFADENHAAGWTVGDGWRLDNLRAAERTGL